MKEEGGRGKEEGEKRKWKGEGLSLWEGAGQHFAAPTSRQCHPEVCEVQVPKAARSCGGVMSHSVFPEPELCQQWDQDQVMLRGQPALPTKEGIVPPPAPSHLGGLPCLPTLMSLTFLQYCFCSQFSSCVTPVASSSIPARCWLKDCPGCCHSRDSIRDKVMLLGHAATLPPVSRAPPLLEKWWPESVCPLFPTSGPGAVAFSAWLGLSILQDEPRPL